MLSAAAWNAFLKTLEEPPPHVVFVLATTEAHKVPATIVDRCHRFDFQRPSLEQIAGVLRRVADRGGDRAARPRGRDDRPRRPPAASATRSARSSSSSPTAASKVELDDVLEILGVADAELVLDAAEALADRDPRAALLAVAAAVRRRARLHPVHARPVGPPAPPVRGPDAGRGAGLVLRHRRAHRPPGRAGRALLAGRDPARDRPARRGDRAPSRTARSRASSSRWRC